MGVSQDTGYLIGGLVGTSIVYWGLHSVPLFIKKTTIYWLVRGPERAIHEPRCNPLMTE